MKKKKDIRKYPCRYSSRLRKQAKNLGIHPSVLLQQIKNRSNPPSSIVTSNTVQSNDIASSTETPAPHSPNPAQNSELKSETKGTSEAPSVSHDLALKHFSLNFGQDLPGESKWYKGGRVQDRKWFRKGS